MSSGSHNLNIQMYSFKEVLELFNLSYNISLEELKRAKMMVLKMHPDKSRLPPDYFLFYKKAYEIVYQYYNDQVKTSHQVPHSNIDYTPMNQGENTNQIAESIQKASEKSDFQTKFNSMFEKNMAKQIDESKNDWFRNNDPLYDYGEVKTKDHMSRTLESIKEKNSALIKHNQIQNMVSSSNGSQLYEEEDSNTYVSCDPFGKLKFDDLRKVHKDETVFAVSERDYDKVQKFRNVDEYNRSRSSQILTPLEKASAEMQLKIEQDAYRERMLAKQHQAHLETLQYAEKNKNVMATFLRLQN